MRGASKWSICAYCGGPNPTETDHVPPRSLFAKPRPSNLLTVPACSKCHRDTSTDDEYFRTHLAFSQTIGEHPDVQYGSGGALDAALRNLQRSTAKGFSRTFLQSVREVPVRSPAGLYLGTATTYDVDRERFFRTLERTMRGLFFRERGKPLGPDFGVKVLHDSFVDWTRFNPEQLSFVQKTVSVLKAKEPVRVGRVFRYSYLCMEENERATAWLLTFYDVENFLVLSAPENLANGL